MVVRHAWLTPDLMSHCIQGLGPQKGRHISHWSLITHTYTYIPPHHTPWSHYTHSPLAVWSVSELLSLTLIEVNDFRVKRQTEGA